MKIKVLLVGVGGYGSGYVRALTGRDFGAEIAGIVDVMPNIREVCPEVGAFGLTVYSSLSDFYKENTADLAILASPIHLHTEMSIQCMKSGSHVLCEKPLCLTVEEAGALDACQAQTGKWLAVGYQMNYRRDVLALKKDILSGIFGAPKRLSVAHACRRGSKYYARNNWAGRISANGREVFDSPFTNACAHNFQMLTFLIGKDLSSACDITGVEAEVYRGNRTVENYDTAFMKFSTDTGADIFYYTAHPLSKELVGPYGKMEFEKGVIEFGPDQRFTAKLNSGETKTYDIPDTDAYDQKLIDAIEGAKTGVCPVCTTKSEIGHIKAVRFVQALPVKNADEQNVEITQDANRGTCYHIKGLEETLIRCYENWCLPKDLKVEF